MTRPGFAELKKTLEECFAEQVAYVADWHTAEPEDIDVPEGEATPATLRALIAREHLRNYRLWHVEDEARRKDVGPEIIAQCKRDIDGLNQSRNDYMEKVDACIVELVLPHLPQNAAERYNTETIGAAVDRLSIISLKMFHMREQTERADVSEEHIRSCQQKLAVLQEQSADLQRSVLELVDDYAEGRKRPKVYYQFKMYNDPSLNPAVYGAAQAASK
ncbi:DUF4254 domain-containing protein [Desulfobaculum sp.]